MCRTAYCGHMSTPRFTPRQLCRVPKEFGKVEDPEWLADFGQSDGWRDQLGAAQMQHRFSYAMRSRIRSVGRGTVLGYAAETGADATRLGRMLRGEVIMRLEDIASAERHLDLSISIAALRNSYAN